MAKKRAEPETGSMATRESQGKRRGTMTSADCEIKKSERETRDADRSSAGDLLLL